MKTYFLKKDRIFNILHVNSYNNPPHTLELDRKSTCYSKKTYYNIKFKYEHYFQQMKPVFIIMRLMGMFPVEISATGELQFRLFSPITAYSVCHYLMQLAINVICLTFLIQHFISEDDFNISIMYVMMINFAIVCIFSPILSWIDMPKFLEYNKKWNDFQELFFKVTTSHLKFCRYRHTMLYAIGSGVFGIPLLYLCTYLPNQVIWGLPCACIALVMGFLCGSYWINTFKMLDNTGNLLAQRFKSDLAEKQITVNMIADYRILWLRLSQLVSQTDMLLGKVVILQFTVCIFILTALIYTVLYVSRKNMIIESTGMSIVAIILIFFLYQFCCLANHVTEMVTNDIQEQLLLIHHHKVDEKVGIEVNAFLQTIFMKPPRISLSGFINIDKELFKGYVSTTVTYMIVLLQFHFAGIGNDYDIST